MNGGGLIAVEVGGDVVDVADLEAGGAVHRPSAGVERRRRRTSTRNREVELAAGAAVEVVIGGHRQPTSNLVAVAAARLHIRTAVRSDCNVLISYNDICGKDFRIGTLTKFCRWVN